MLMHCGIFYAAACALALSSMGIGAMIVCIIYQAKYDKVDGEMIATLLLLTCAMFISFVLVLMAV